MYNNEALVDQFFHRWIDDRDLEPKHRTPEQIYAEMDEYSLSPEEFLEPHLNLSDYDFSH